LNYICGPANIDCSPINQGGDHYLPNDLISHANWAFNEYYQKIKKQEVQEHVVLEVSLNLFLPPQEELEKRERNTIY